MAHGIAIEPMSWLKNNFGTVATIGIFLLGLAFSTGVIWMKVESLDGRIEDTKDDVKIIHNELHKYHEPRPLLWEPPEEPEPK